MNIDSNNLETVKSAVKPANVLLPSKNIDIKNWPVIACDQYTSDPKYWEKVQSRVMNTPSAYHIILPELYLEHPGEIPVIDRVKKINDTMNSYVKNNVLESIGEFFVLIDRKTSIVPSRKGLLISIDLDKYDYKPDSNNLIRATEGTVEDRIPPRMQIRKEACVEIPHVQLLCDDPNKSIIEPLFEKASKDKFEVLYDLDLPENGGHITGYKVPKEYNDNIFEALANLDSLKSHSLLFAVGDGNHSLATAKSHWDSLKSNVSNDHPARYALVELINIYDEGIIFEPIHRVLFGITLDRFINKCKDFPNSQIDISSEMSLDNAILMAKTISKDQISVPVFSGQKAFVLTFSNFKGKFHADAMQQLIDWKMNLNPNIKVDYIHGEESVLDLSKKHIGILLPPILKETFFETIASNGVFPRKTFSIGESFEKRYYIEAKLINNI